MGAKLDLRRPRTKTELLRAIFDQFGPRVRRGRLRSSRCRCRAQGEPDDPARGLPRARDDAARRDRGHARQRRRADGRRCATSSSSPSRAGECRARRGERACARARDATRARASARAASGCGRAPRGSRGGARARRTWTTARPGCATARPTALGRRPRGQPVGAADARLRARVAARGAPTTRAPPRPCRTGTSATAGLRSRRCAPPGGGGSPRVLPADVVAEPQRRHGGTGKSDTGCRRPASSMPRSRAAAHREELAVPHRPPRMTPRRHRRVAERGGRAASSSARARARAGPPPRAPRAKRERRARSRARGP